MVIGIRVRDVQPDHHPPPLPSAPPGGVVIRDRGGLDGMRERSRAPADLDEGDRSRSEQGLKYMRLPSGAASGSRDDTAGAPLYERLPDGGMADEPYVVKRDAFGSAAASSGAPLVQADSSERLSLSSRPSCTSPRVPRPRPVVERRLPRKLWLGDRGVVQPPLAGPASTLSAEDQFAGWQEALAAKPDA